MIHRPLLAPAAALALLTGGCMGTRNRGLESVHQPVVTRSTYALDLQVAGDELAAGEQDRLLGWFDAMRLGYGDRVAVDFDGAGGAARAQVGGVVAAYGLLLADEPSAPSTPLTAGTVRVLVSRARAGVPGCPDYSRNVSHEFDGNTSSNYGCASNINLAAMVADPLDLVRGQSGRSYADTAVSTKAIDTFRKATPTGAGNALKVESVGGKK